MKGDVISDHFLMLWFQKDSLPFWYIYWIFLWLYKLMHQSTLESGGDDIKDHCC